MTNTAELLTKDTITLIINKKNPDKVTYVFKTGMEIRSESM